LVADVTLSVLSPEVIASRPPCGPLSSPSLVASPEADGRTLTLPTVSAGSGTAVLAPAAVVSFTTGSASVEAEALAGVSPEVGALSEDFPPDPFDVEPLDPLLRCAAPERELPVLDRDGDMMPLSLTVSAAASSGSAFRTGGAMISGGWVDRPASSTPSSSVLTGAPMYLLSLTLSESLASFRRCYPSVSCFNRSFVTRIVLW